MEVNGKNYRTVWMEGSSVFLIEQNLLPFEFKIYEAKDHFETCQAIKNMLVRGAGAIGSAAGFAMAQAFLESGKPEYLAYAKNRIEATRPTAQNLFYATNLVYENAKSASDKKKEAVRTANYIADKDAEDSLLIGKHGNEIIPDNAGILTHCNAGWLAFTDFGTALSPIYLAYEQKKDIFVYADETRPRAQGARLTAWELNNAGIPHAIIPDNAAAYYMQQGKIDLVITGADRIAANGDTANKIGTLEKAICAHEFGIPFYIAAPTSTIDLNCKNGDMIEIEERDPREVLFQQGPDGNGKITEIRVASPGSNALNPAFDVTPAKLISGIITEKGIIKASQSAIVEITG
ncbi:S-methyl-5-thioribose-1-phosphate isomerase [Candidatus Cloacimonadota bacterium]